MLLEEMCTLGKRRGWHCLGLFLSALASSLLNSSMPLFDFLHDLGFPLKTNILNGLPSESKVKFSATFFRYASYFEEKTESTNLTVAPLYTIQHIDHTIFSKHPRIQNPKSKFQHILHVPSKRP